MPGHISRGCRVSVAGGGCVFWAHSPMHLVSGAKSFEKEMQGTQYRVPIRLPASLHFCGEDLAVSFFRKGNLKSERSGHTTGSKPGAQNSKAGSFFFFFNTEELPCLPLESTKKPVERKGNLSVGKTQTLVWIRFASSQSQPGITEKRTASKLK